MMTFQNFRDSAAAMMVVLAMTYSVSGAPPAEKINVEEFPAALMQDVVVPVPSEIFGVLDKLGQPNWALYLADDVKLQPQDRAHVALLLGSVIANGFVAVQAEDAEKVKNIGREVLNLSSALGVRESVIARSNRIISAADARDWLKVRRQLDGAMQDVRGAMVELHDEQLAQLVSLGGWIRGTQVLTEVVKSDYSPETAELLHQPQLLEYFRGRISGMKKDLKNNPLVDEVQISLGEMQPLIEVGDGRKITSESVDKINMLTSELVRKFKSDNA